MKDNSRDKDYRAVYDKDPFAVEFKLQNMKSGDYLVKGDVKEDMWAKSCKRIGVPVHGCCSVDIDVEKTRAEIGISGTIYTTMMRTCVRTLKEFELQEELKFAEKVPLRLHAAEQEGDVFEGEVFNMGDYLTEQIIISMDPYPTHPDVLSAKEGAFDVTDGLDEEVKEEKNPFSVLKDLKL